MSDTATSTKNYQITLTVGELDFIKDFLMGINDFMQHLHAHFDSSFEFERDLERIDPYWLADKIFKQYIDEDGELR